MINPDTERSKKRRGLGVTPIDLIWSSTIGAESTIRRLAEAAVDSMLYAVWKGFDDLFRGHLAGIDLSLATDDLERALTQLLERHIREHVPKEAVYQVQHGPYEHATRKPRPSQPPQYDIAFVFRDDQRIMWPLEAKVLRTDSDVSEYVADIRDCLLTGRYAPYMSSAAMIGYLIRGNGTNVVTELSNRLKVPLLPHNNFSPARCHHISQHVRQPTFPIAIGGAFICHHLIMPMTASATDGDG